MRIHIPWIRFRRRKPLLLGVLFGALWIGSAQATTPHTKFNPGEQKIADTVLKKTASLLECPFSDPARVLLAAEQFEELITLYESNLETDPKIKALNRLSKKSKIHFKKYCSLFSSWRLPVFGKSYELILQRYSSSAKKFLEEQNIHPDSIQPGVTLEINPATSPNTAAKINENRRKIIVDKALRDYLVANRRQINAIGFQAGSGVSFGINIGRSINTLGRKKLSLSISGGIVAGAEVKFTYLNGRQKGLLSEVAGNEHEDQILTLEYPYVVSHSGASEPALSSHEFGLSTVSPAAAHAVLGADDDGAYPTVIRSIHTFSLPYTTLGRDLDLLKKELGIPNSDLQEE